MARSRAHSTNDRVMLIAPKWISFSSATETSTMHADFDHLLRTRWCRAIARLLIVILVNQNVPVGSLREADAATGVLWVDGAGGCRGELPCFSTIQGAIDAAGSGETVRVLAGDYVEQLRITGKNQGAAALEVNRITIEADPAAVVGEVVLRGPHDQCRRGHAVVFKKSSFVTLRGFRIEGAGKRGIALRGGSAGGQGIHLERNRLHVGSPRECLGGIEVGRGNPDTVIANNVIAGVRRNALRFRNRSGRAVVTGNTIIRNEGYGLFLSRDDETAVWNNLVALNGFRKNGKSTRKVGVRRQRATQATPDGASDVRNNLVCGNAGGEFQGPLFGTSDVGNVTPTGSEGPMFVASPECGSAARLFHDLDGADDALDTVDDDFSLADASPAADAGLDPQGQGTGVADEIFEADYSAPGVRPGGPAFDIGAVEITGPRPTRTATPSPTPTVTVSSAPTVSPTPTTSPTPSPTTTVTATVTATPTPAPSVTPTTTSAAGVTATRTTTPVSPALTATATPTRTATPVRTTTATPTVTATPTATAHVLPDNDHYEVVLGQTLTVAAPGVLANDVDQLGHSLSSTKLSDPDKGSLDAFGSDGSFTFTAPPTYGTPPLQPVVRFHNPTGQQGTVHRVVDVNGDGKPDVVFHGANRFLGVVDGVTGDFVWASANFGIPAPNDDCAIDTLARQLVVGDLDDDGIPEIVQSLRCARDGSGVGVRYVIINARTGEVERITDPVWADPVGVGGTVTGDTLPTIARLAPGEPPSLIIGTTGESNFGDCSRYVAGAPGPGNYCRVVSVVDGVTGTLKQQMFALGAGGEGTRDGAGRKKVPPIVFDLDGDGDLEIVSAGAVFNQDGTVAWEWPNGVFRTAIANLDDTPDAEVVMLTAVPGGGNLEGLHAFKANGEELWSFPLTHTNIFGYLGVADVDRDGLPDILLTAFDYGTNRDYLLVLDREGQVKWLHYFPVTPPQQSHTGPDNRPAVYDLDDDGVPEVIVQTTHDVYFLDGTDGQVETTFHYNTVGNGIETLIPTVADLDGNGHAEVVFQSGFGVGGNNDGGLWVLHGLNDDWRPVQGIDHQLSHYGGNTAGGVDGAIPYPSTNPFATPRTNVFGNPAEWPYLPTFVGRDQTSFLYEATDGGESAPALVSIDILPTNRPPKFTSTPPTAYTVNQPFTYNAVAVDPDAGDTITYSFAFTASDQPYLCSIGATSGVFTCSTIGFPFTFVTQTFTLIATDSHGAIASQVLMLKPSTGAAVVPNVVGMQQGAAAIAITGAGLQVGSVDTLVSPFPAGQVITQTPAAGRTVKSNSSVRISVSLGPPADPRDVDDDGDGYSENQGDCDDALPARNPGANDTVGNGSDENCDGIDGVLPIAAIVVTPANDVMVTGNHSQYIATATLTDGTSADVTSIVVWQSSQPGVATIATTGEAHGVAVGTTTISATRGAVSGATSLGVLARSIGDQTDPIALITTPANGGEVTQPIDVIGTADDATFLKYELAYALAGTSDFTVLATGTSPVVNGVLGQLDPTMLLNDLYDLRLTVFDRADNEASTIATVSVTRDMKIGNFSLTFTDLSVPVSGIPIVVSRTYDSRDKGTGDFGVGWRLGVQTLRIRANREQGSGWAVVRSGPLAWGLTPVGQHVVSLTLPSGKVEQFDLRITPTLSTFQPFSLGLVATYVPRSGTLGTLQLLDNPHLAIIDDQTAPVTPVTLMDDVTFDTFDPQRFRYVSVDGQRIDVNRTTGVERIEDPNGNALTIGPGGITHSSGKSVQFTRDAEGRIIAITDPNGHAQSYGYDARGDLVTHTDQAGNVTRMFYDGRHGLLRMVDPLGRPIARNEFDDDGRLIASTSATGRRITYVHDVDTRQEVLTDDDGSITVVDYDASGHIVRVTDPLGGVTTHTYDADGNQLTTTDPLGHTTSRTYDATRNVTSSTDALGHTTTFARDSRGAVLARTDARGHVLAFTYDAAGNTLTQTNGAGVVEQTNTYDAQGKLLTRTDGAGALTQFVHDASGFQIAEIDPHGNQSEITYDAQGNPLTDEDRRGKTIVTTYDARGLFAKKRDQSGNETTFTFDEMGTLTGVTDALGHSSGIVVDADGRELAATDAAGHATTRTYDAKGNIATSTDAAGHTTHYEYDVLGRRTKVTYADGTFETFGYDAAGRNTSRTDGNGHTTTFAYDDADRLVRATDALGGVTVYEHDAVGNVIEQTDALGNVFTYVYDGANRQIGVIFPDGGTTATTYDGVNRPLSVTDAAGHTTHHTYDGNGNLLTTTDAAGGVTSFTYDPEGNALTQTDANGHTTTFTYDANGRPTSATLPGGQGSQYEYDATGNITKTTTQNGDVLVDEFDAARRKTARIYPGGGRVDFTYTVTGKIASAADARGTTLYAYDARDRVAAIQNPDGSSIAYGYDGVGNRTSVTTRTASGALDRTTTYAYDALDRMASVTDPDGRVSTYGYDAIGNLTSVQYANGTTTTYTYDVASRLAVIEHERSGTVLDRFTYTVNAVGDRTRVDALDTSYVVYDYDVLRRLTRETRHDTGGAVVHELVYTYDAVGNRVTHTLNGGTAVAYTHDVNDRLLSRGSVTFSYDANGNTTSRTAGGPPATYAYDYENRLVATTESNGVTTTYEYDTRGDRVRKNRTTGTVNYLIDPLNGTGHSQVVEEYGGGGIPLASYVYGTELVSQERGADLSFYHRDGGHSTRALTDENGNVTDRYDYDAFGEPHTQSGVTDNAYRFSGEQQDPELGLYYLRARYYSPETGRFFSVDPFAGQPNDPVSLHRYLYARVNPVNFRDPSGRSGEPNTLAEVMFVNALIGIAFGVVTDAVMCGAFDTCKSTGEFVWSIVFNGVFGSLGGALGTVGGKLGTIGVQAAMKAQNKFVGGLVRFFVSNGAVHLLVAGAKAAAATVNTVLQALVETGVRPKLGQRPPSMPSAKLLGTLFVANLVTEAFFLNASQAEILAESAGKVFANNPAAKKLAAELIEKQGETNFGSNLYARLSKFTPEQQQEFKEMLLQGLSNKFSSGYVFSGVSGLEKAMEVLESYLIAAYGAVVQFEDGLPAKK